MPDALRTYLEVAMGLTDASRKTVRKAVKEAVGRSNATASQVKTLTNDLLASNAANRDALAKLVRFEVDRALGVVGLATAEEVTELTDRVRDLENQLREAERTGPVPAATPAPRRPRKTAVKTAPTAEPAGEPAVAPAPVARKKVARKAVAKKATAGDATAVAAKAVAKKAVAAKAVARKTVARKAAKKTTGAPA